METPPLLLPLWCPLPSPFCMQEVILARSADLLRATPVVLQALYEADVLEEDAIVTWAASPAVDAGLLARAKPFLDWLATAEEDEEEED
jgi:hypothetical protein